MVEEYWESIQSKIPTNTMWYSLSIWKKWLICLDVWMFCDWLHVLRGHHLKKSWQNRLKDGNKKNLVFIHWRYAAYDKTLYHIFSPLMFVFLTYYHISPVILHFTLIWTIFCSESSLASNVFVEVSIFTKVGCCPIKLLRTPKVLLPTWYQDRFSSSTHSNCWNNRSTRHAD